MKMSIILSNYSVLHCSGVLWILWYNKISLFCCLITIGSLLTNPLVNIQKDIQNVLIKVSDIINYKLVGRLVVV